MKLPVIPSISLILLASSISSCIAAACPSVDFIKDEANWVVHQGALVLKNVPGIGTMSSNNGSIQFIQQNIGVWDESRIDGGFAQCVYTPNFIFTTNNRGYSFGGRNRGFGKCPNVLTPDDQPEKLRLRDCAFFN